ncbi:flagellar hook-length control protein FliK [Anaerotignum sp.]|uniref:flagellar hook-length control protein FliK n=1 Tax=Anaerotignum sp. TaxID=2039241 RepID=UPI0027152554|nr:flagellar hook-length control protein FliK [Anaerotignum sp.]
MNNCSVSINKSIPETGKVEMKSKSSKSEDSFKDMIKNVSNQKTTDRRSQVTKKEQGTGKETGSSVQEDTKETKDDKANLNELASLVINSGGAFDPVQLAKAVGLSAAGQNDGNVLANEQGGVGQAGLIESAVQNGTGLESMQTVSIAQGLAKMQLAEKAPVVYASQTVLEDESKDTASALLKQNVATNLVENTSNSTADLKQNMFMNDENNGGTFSQGNEGVDTGAITAPDLPPLPSDSTADNVIMIKVGDPSLESSWKQVAEEIGNMVVEKINNEVQKVNIKLTPKELGEIDVEFLINKGKISVTLNCSDEATKALLATNLDSLSKVVQTSLMQDVNVNLNYYNKTDGQNTGSENFDGSGNHGQYQGDSNEKRREQDQPNLDFAQRLRLGIDNIEVAEV